MGRPLIHRAFSPLGTSADCEWCGIEELEGHSPYSRQHSSSTSSSTSQHNPRAPDVTDSGCRPRIAPATCCWPALCVAGLFIRPALCLALAQQFVEAPALLHLRSRWRSRSQCPRFQTFLLPRDNSRPTSRLGGLVHNQTSRWIVRYGVICWPWLTGADNERQRQRQ